MTNSSSADMPLGGVVHKAVEAERLDKEIAKVRAEIETVR